jgi:predicted O-methyltransferase YrrM
MNNEEEKANLKESIDQLCKLTEALSVHQRHLFLKVEEISSNQAQLYAHQDRIYSQIDALFSIHALINIRHPLPTMRGWPVSPDFVKMLMTLILDEKPGTIVETGSGVSSIVAGYCLEKNGTGTLVSYEHDEEYAGVSLSNIESHRLGRVVTVVHAPLRKINVHDETYIWYDPLCINVQNKIDLLVIDGPPGHLQRMARYPALPVFFDRLSDHAVVLLDDAAREDEKIIVERWLKEYGCFRSEYVETEKGATILRRTSSNVS